MCCLTPLFLISDFDKAYFWKWTYFTSYLQFTAVFTVVVGLMTWLFLDNMYYVETIGFLAVFAEAMLGAPQFYRNFVNKSTHGMRYVYEIVSLLTWYLLIVINVPKFSLIYQKCVQQRGCSRVLARICLTGIRIVMSTGEYPLCWTRPL